MKRLVSLLFVLTLSLTMMAVPARRVAISVTQPDGTTLSLIPEGDEWFSFYTDTKTGRHLVRQADGFYREVSEKEIIRSREPLPNCILKQVKSPLKGKKVAKTGPLGNNVSRHDLTGKKKALVIMVNFADKQFTYSNDRINQQMNTVGYNMDGHNGSVHDYFLAQSYGQFDLQVDVIGPVTVSGTSSYYGAPSGGMNDSHVGEMVKEALQLADSQGVDFSDYDWDGDGEVEMVTCLYAGYGQAQSGDTNTIWPQQWTLTKEGSGTITLDGKTINTYLVLNELKGSGGDNLDGIGTFVHEFSHSLGLPDIYDTSGKTFGGCFGMGEWSVMDYGMYNGDSAIPCNYTAMERAFCGWLDLKELNDEDQSVTLAPMADGGDAYILYNEGHKDEYYLVYNVNKSGWDQGVPGSGLVVMHVDYVQGIWTGNYVNTDATHRHCTLIPANNDYHSGAGNVYPGTTGNTSLCDDTTPATTLFNANYDGSYLMHKALQNIALSGNDVTFDFKGWQKPDVQTVVAQEATQVSTDGFTAVWNAVEGDGITYTLELNTAYAYELPAPEPVLSQDFSTDFYIGASSDGDVWKDLYDSSQNMNGYLSVATKPGSWGYGVIESPKFSISSGRLTIKVEMLDIKGTSPDIQFILIDAAGNEAKSATIHWDEQLVSFTGVGSGTYKLRIVEAANYGAFGLVSLQAYDEAYTLEQLTSGGGTAYDVRTDLIPGLTSTSYEVKNSSMPVYWTYRVRAVCEGVNGEWSNIIIVYPTTVLKGDINMDGKVDVDDVTAMAEIILGTWGGEHGEADLDGDGIINVTDLAQLVEILE